jgi:glycosyltransferase involved in cell wall biosynthesis
MAAQSDCYTSDCHTPNRYTFVFLQIFSAEGGIQSYVKDVLQGFLDANPNWGADVFLLRDGLQDLKPENLLPLVRSDRLTLHPCRFVHPQLSRLALIGSLTRHLLSQPPTQVICGHIYLLPLVRPLCQTLGIPFQVMTYGKEVWEPLPSKFQQGLKAAQGIWTISRYSRDRLCAANALDPSTVRMIPCGVDSDRFCPGEPDADLVARYGLAGHKVLLTVARLWSGDIYKGVDVTLRALPQILQQDPSVKYVIIGRGDDQPRLMQLAQDLGVADQVVFAGFVATEALVHHYRLATAYVMPSQEGFGIVYLEAMACGIPVLSGDADGSADPLQDGAVGWQVPHRAPEAVAAAVLAMLRGEDQRCDGVWLRAETIARFSKKALALPIQAALRLSSNAPQTPKGLGR